MNTERRDTRRTHAQTPSPQTRVTAAGLEDRPSSPQGEPRPPAAHPGFTQEAPTNVAPAHHTAHHPQRAAGSRTTQRPGARQRTGETLPIRAARRSLRRRLRKNSAKMGVLDSAPDGEPAFKPRLEGRAQPRLRTRRVATSTYRLKIRCPKGRAGSIRTFGIAGNGAISGRCPDACTRAKRRGNTGGPGRRNDAAVVVQTLVLAGHARCQAPAVAPPAMAPPAPVAPPQALRPLCARAPPAAERQCASHFDRSLSPVCAASLEPARGPE
jgi:hypothetical protein